MDSELVEIDVEIRHQTQPLYPDRGAYLIYNGNVEVWLPKKMIEDYTEEKSVIKSIFIPRWLAEEKELV